MSLKDLAVLLPSSAALLCLCRLLRYRLSLTMEDLRSSLVKAVQQLILKDEPDQLLRYHPHSKIDFDRLLRRASNEHYHTVDELKVALTSLSLYNLHDHYHYLHTNAVE